MKRILFSLVLLFSVFSLSAQEAWKEHSFMAFEAYKSQNYEEACHWAYMALDEGVGDAIPGFYMILSECEMGCKRGDKAMIAAENAGKRGIPDGYYVAGMLCLDGSAFNATLNVKKGLDYLSKAADADHLAAILELANCYNQGTYGVTPNSYEYFRYIKKAADLGDVLALYNMGWCYQSGTGVSKDLQKAESYFLRLVDEGVYLGYNQMGYSCAYQKKYADAYRWFDRGIEAYQQKGASSYSWDWTLDNLYDSKGEVMLMEGKYEEAMPIYRRLVSSADTKIQESAFIKRMAAYLADDIDKVPSTSIRSSNTFALIVANENYMRVDNVSYALNDGRTFRDYCIKTLGIPSSNIIYVADATRNDFVFALADIKRKISSNPQADLIVYYAGHGIPDDATKSAYLLPVDGYGTDVSTGYSLEKLYSELGALPNKVAVFLDACFSGAKREGGMVVEARGVALKAQKTDPKGNTFVLSAAQGDETALPYYDKYHGMYTYFLLKKIKENRGNVTLGELSDYVISNVSKSSVQINNKQQTPTALSSPKISGEWRSWTLR